MKIFSLSLFFQQVLPAAVLNSPFYDENIPKYFKIFFLPFFSDFNLELKNFFISYLNYGAIGSIIGHELTHGFDDAGIYFETAENFETIKILNLTNFNKFNTLK